VKDIQGPGEKIRPFSVVAVEFAFNGPALVVPMIAAAMIPVPTRVMRRTLAVEALSTNA